MSAQMPRMESRAHTNAALRVSLLEQPETAEILTVEDLSRHGARAVSAIPWRKGDRVLVKAVKGTFTAYGRIVYCDAVGSEPYRFAVGFEFFSPTGTWEE